jgi:hypothetical protein
VKVLVLVQVLAAGFRVLTQAAWFGYCCLEASRSIFPLLHQKTQPAPYYH